VILKTEPSESTYRQLQKHICQFPYVKKCEFYEGAKVPILHCELGVVQVDINLAADDRHQGLLVTRFILEHKQGVVASYLVLKQAMRKRGLLSLYKGGLSSTLLFHMVLAYHRAYPFCP
jgi:hypothetical protein